MIPDETIHVLDFEGMKYPLGPHARQIEGVVVVRAGLDEKGAVSTATALSGEASLIADTLDNVKRWRFHPNQQRAVIVVYDFKVDGVCNGFSSHSVFRRPNVMVVRGCRQLTFQP